jgi:hypothetical protein
MLLAGATYYYYLRPVEPDPCRACSIGTRCAAGLCVATNIQAQPVTRKRGPQRARGSSGGSAGSGGFATSSGGSSGGLGSPGGADSPAAVEPAAPEAPPPPPPPPLRPEEKRLVTVGDKLTGTEVVNLAESGSGADRELSQEDIDAVFRPRQSAIVGCIDEARGDAQLEATITVAFRIRRSGDIAGVRLEAPAYLINHGLMDCVRRIVTSLHFPSSAKAQIVTYPFSLR